SPCQGSLLVINNSFSWCNSSSSLVIQYFHTSSLIAYTMEPNFQSPVSSPSRNRPTLSVPLLILIFLLLLALLFVFGKSFRGDGEGNQAITKEDVIVNETDLATLQGDERTPLGFPADVPKPLPEDIVTESYSMNYTEKGVTLYSFAFDTGRPFE